jgi:hypothetical protein
MNLIVIIFNKMICTEVVASLGTIHLELVHNSSQNKYGALSSHLLLRFLLAQVNFFKSPVYRRLKELFGSFWCAINGTYPIKSSQYTLTYFYKIALITIIFFMWSLRCVLYIWSTRRFFSRTTNNHVPGLYYCVSKKQLALATQQATSVKHDYLHISSF